MQLYSLICRGATKCSVYLSICVAECVFRSVFYGLEDGELAFCRQPLLILWPPPKLQHVGNKPFSSNPQTVLQSMGNYLSQSMGQPFYFSISLPFQLSYLYPFSRHPSLALLLLIPSVSFFAVSIFLHPLRRSPPSPTFTCFPSSPLSTYSEMRQLSSSRAINRSCLHPWNM